MTSSPLLGSGNGAGGNGGVKPLTPGFSTGGIELLKVEAKRTQKQQYDIGPIDDDVAFLNSYLDTATVAAVKCEWERHATWENFNCPPAIHDAATPVEMIAAMTHAQKESLEKPQLAISQKGGRGRGKAKGPHKKYTEVLASARVLLEQVVQWKSTEISNRRSAYKTVKESKNCTCWWSASPQALCGVCRGMKKKLEVQHSVEIKKNENGHLGLRFQGEWVMYLAEITHGSPAADIPQLERYLEHIVSHVNGVPVAGKEVIEAIRRAPEDVTINFYHRYMDYPSSKQQYERQLKSGRPPPVPIGPTQEDIQNARAGYRAASVSPVPLPPTGKHKSHPLIESPSSRPADESFIGAFVRRYQSCRHPELLTLENLCVTRPEAWPALFRFVTKSERNKEQSKAAGTNSHHPNIPSGIFRKADLLAFYPPPLNNERRHKMPPLMQKCVKLIETLRAKHQVESFMVVVDEAKHGAPKYYEMIQKPIDLGSILTRLNCQLYSTVDEVKADIDQVWVNCRTYNPETHWLHKAANDIEKEFNALWKKESFKGAKNLTQVLPQTPRLDYRSAAGRIFSLIEGLPPFHSSFLRIVESLGEAGYRILTEPQADKPDMIDIIVEIVPSAITEANLREIISITSEKGQMNKKRKT